MELFSTWALIVPIILYVGFAYTVLTFARLEPQRVRANRRFPL